MSRMGDHRSPFDPYLVAFLAYVQRHGSSFSPGSSRSLARAAETLDLPPAFIEALFASAGGRGLVRPGRGRHGRMQWELSRRGQEFLAAAAQPDGAS